MTVCNFWRKRNTDVADGTLDDAQSNDDNGASFAYCGMGGCKGGIHVRTPSSWRLPPHCGVSCTLQHALKASMSLVEELKSRRFTLLNSQLNFSFGKSTTAEQQMRLETPWQHGSCLQAAQLVKGCTLRVGWSTHKGFQPGASWMARTLR